MFIFVVQIKNVYLLIFAASHDNPIDVNTDYHWRRFVMELCHGQIVTNVIPSGLLPNLGLIFCGGMFLSLNIFCNSYKVSICANLLPAQ